MNEEKCVICHQPLIGHGHNPAPVREEGDCCGTCNQTIVVPMRIKTAKMSREHQKAYIENWLQEYNQQAKHLI